MPLTHTRQTQSIRLADGRRLSYAEYGTSTGFPVFLFHGTPGTRLWFEDDDEVATSLGLRLIAPERPGFGLSDPKSARTLLDWPADVAELADQLQLHKFSVLGVSGGGVYAAACAYKLPERLQAVALVSTIAPFQQGKPPKSMCRPNRMAFYLSRSFPWLLKCMYRYQKWLLEKSPEQFMKSIQAQTAHLCKQDKEIVQQEKTARAFMLQLKEALNNHVDAATLEPALLSADWGFNCSRLSIPVHVWHGTEDTLAPLSEVKKLADLIPNCTTHFVEGGGHFIIEDPQAWTAMLKPLNTP